MLDGMWPVSARERISTVSRWWLFWCWQFACMSNSIYSYVFSVLNHTHDKRSDTMPNSINAYAENIATPILYALRAMHVFPTILSYNQSSSAAALGLAHASSLWCRLVVSLSKPRNTTRNAHTKQKSMCFRHHKDILSVRESEEAEV